MSVTGTASECVSVTVVYDVLYAACVITVVTKLVLKPCGCVAGCLCARHKPVYCHLLGVPAPLSTCCNMVVLECNPRKMEISMCQ